MNWYQQSEEFEGNQNWKIIISRYVYIKDIILAVRQLKISQKN